MGFTELIRYICFCPRVKSGDSDYYSGIMNEYLVFSPSYSRQRHAHF